MTRRYWSKVQIAFLSTILIGVLIYFLNTTGRSEVINVKEFYRTSLATGQRAGTLIRIEKLTTRNGAPVILRGGRCYRILYVSDTSTGMRILTGGMLFVPRSRAPVGGRPVVAWAHPTLSPANVAPSSSNHPLKALQPWLSQMLARGWDVVATDYAGLGTTGHQEYLNGLSEARDVVYSVSAIESLRIAAAGPRWVAWGLSYGGHAVLWTASQAPRIDDHLHLLGVAVAAPVANVVFLGGAEDQAWRSTLAAEEPPIETSIPVLIVQGTRDIAVPLSNTQVVALRWCSHGAGVTLRVFRGATHESITVVASATVVQWLRERFQHGTTSGCSGVG